MSATITVLNISFTAFSVVGNEFIKRRNRHGYWFWLVGNSLGLMTFALLGQWITAALYIYFTTSCVQGLVHWGRLDQQAVKVTEATEQMICLDNDYEVLK